MEDMILDYYTTTDNKGHVSKYLKVTDEVCNETSTFELMTAFNYDGVVYKKVWVAKEVSDVTKVIEYLLHLKDEKELDTLVCIENVCCF